MMHQSHAGTLAPEEPDELIAHVRVCGGAGWVTTGSTRKPTPTAFAPASLRLLARLTAGVRRQRRGGIGGDNCCRPSLGQEASKLPYGVLRQGELTVMNESDAHERVSDLMKKLTEHDDTVRALQAEVERLRRSSDPGELTVRELL